MFRPPRLFFLVSNLNSLLVPLDGLLSPADNGLAAQLCPRVALEVSDAVVGVVVVGSVRRGTPAAVGIAVGNAGHVC